MLIRLNLSFENLKFYINAFFNTTPIKQALFYCLGDAPIAYFDTESFLETLFKRSKAAGTNVGWGYIRPPGIANLPKAFMVTGPSLKAFQAIAGYGENENNLDPASRKIFDNVKILLGQETINNLQGEKTRKEKAKIKSHMNAPSRLEETFQVTQNEFQLLFDEWQDHTLFNQEISYRINNILAKCLFGLPPLDKRYISTMKSIADLITNPWVSTDQLKTANKMLMQISYAMIVNKEDEINLEKYAVDFANAKGEENISQKLIDTNIAGSFIAATNLSDLVMKTIVELSANMSIRKRIIQELEKASTTSITLNDLRKRTYLNAVFIEAQRLYSPSLIARRNSKKCTFEIPDKHEEKHLYTVPPSSYLFAPIRPRHLDAELWEEPLIFNPERFIENPPLQKLVVAFSSGLRGCPARFDFAEVIFKTAIYCFAKSGLIFELENPLETIPVFAINTSWKKNYSAILRNADDISLPVLDNTRRYTRSPH